MYHITESIPSSETGIDTRRIQMPPVLRSHKEYIRFVDRHIQKVQIPKAHDDAPPKLKLLDLTPLRLLFMPLYSPNYCPRFHNSPDASWGYDAYRNCFIFGYNLYQVNS
jgi:hypothetical protein